MCVASLSPVLTLAAALGAAGGPALPGDEAPSVARSFWTIDDGLPQNSVAGCSLDSAGYLWIATFGGLARFDGQRFEVFDVGNREDLPGNRFLQVLCASDDTLWVVAHDVGVLRYREDRFQRIEATHGVLRIIEDAAGRVWTLAAGGVGLVDGDEHRRVRDLANPRTLLPARDGSVWVATFEGTLLRFADGVQSEFGVEHGLPGTPFPALFEDADGRLWAGGKWGVWRATDASNVRFERIEGAPERVRSMAQDDRGAMWFGCADRLVERARADGPFVDVDQGAFDSLLADHRGNVWIGSTSGVGLRCVRPSPLRDATTELSVLAADTWGIGPGRGDSVLVVQNREAFEVRRDGVIRHAFDTNLRCALVDRAGDLWIGQSAGLFHVRGDGWAEIREPGLRGGVRALFEGADGTLWVGSGRGLSRRVGDRFEPAFGDAMPNIRCIAEDAEHGRLWVGTQEGLACVEGDRVTWLTAAEGFSPGSVRTLHLDAEGVLWAGTYGGGLARVEGESVTRFWRGNGLPNDFLATILEDDQQRLWINSNRGLFVVHKDELSRVARGEAERVACALFTPDEGAREANGGNQPTGWRSPDGRLWFPCIDGVVVATPSELPLVEEPPNALIEALAVSDERGLYARFTALGFSAPQRVRVQYRLLGHDAAWVECTGAREARYSYLPPGDYELQVRARNGFGAWSPMVTRPFEIEARLHETKGFLAGIVVLIALGAFGFAELRIKAARERAARLERLHEERDHAERALGQSQVALARLSRGLLVTQETERRRLSSELHDDVTQRLAALAIQAEVAEGRLEDDADRAGELLRGVVEAAQELAGDVQQLSRRLHPVGLRTLGLSEAIRQECDAFTRRSGVGVELDEDVAADELPEDVAVAAFRIFQESLHNIEKHAEASSVSVEVETDDGGLVLSVRDHGRGFDSERGDTTGLGLVTMQERAAAIGGSLSVESSPGVGTTVRLVAPGNGAPR